jgi:hypothetical protein
MCDLHQFQFDVDQGYANQLIAVLEASPHHPLTAPEAPRQIGVYALYNMNDRVPLYVGQALGKTGIRGRLTDHLRKVQGRRGLNEANIVCRFLTIERAWETARAEDALIRHYDPDWNRLRGFGKHVEGGGRPGMPGRDVNEWDRRFPPLR